MNPQEPFGSWSGTETREIRNLLLELNARGVKIWMEDGRLQTHAPNGSLNSSLQMKIEAVAEELKTFLTKKEKILEDYAPSLSFAQQRVWFLEQLQPDNQANRLQATIDLWGPLSVATLERAIAGIVDRHEILRTTFPVRNGVPHQLIHQHASLTLDRLDWRPMEREQQKAQLSDLAATQAHVPFDLTRLPLLRLFLIRNSEDHYTLLLTMHQLVGDQESIHLFCRELGERYAAFHDSQPDRPPLFGSQYSDFSRRQRAYQLEDDAAMSLAYWERHLAGAPPILDLPFDRARTPRLQYHGSQVSFALDMLQSSNLEGMAKRTGSSVFSVLLAAWATLLSRLCRTDDLVIGLPVANRGTEEWQGLMGPFVNTLPLRLQPRRHLTFLGFLQKVRETSMQAFEHGEIPFEKIVEVVQPERDLSHHPLIQVMFSLRNMPSEELSFANINGTLNEYELQANKLDLSLVMWESLVDGSLHGSFHYNTELFDATTIQRWINHFITLVASITADNKKPLCDLVWLNAREHHALLSAGRPRPEMEFEQGLFWTNFEEQAKQRPEVPAILSDRGNLTRGKLLHQANCLALYLRAQGLQPGDRVSFFLEDHYYVPMTWLAVMRAGGVLVPLNPNHSPTRLSWQIHDAKIRVILCERHLETRLPRHRALQIFYDQLDEVLTDDDYAVANLPLPTPQQGALLAYTTDNEGNPRGLLLSHQLIHNHLRAVLGLFRFQPGDRMLLLSPLAQDMGIEQILAPLAAGVAVVTAAEIHHDGDWLTHLIGVHAVTHLIAPPTLLQNWLDSLVRTHGQARLQHLRVVLSGSETLAPEILELWAETPLKHRARLINSYGPSEMGICTTAFEVPSTWFETAAPTRIPIGHPRGSSWVAVLDPQGQPVPTGVPGELCIGGRVTSECFVNQPIKTAELLRPDPFGGQRGSRLFRTGDLARFKPRPDGSPGNLEYLGRAANQIWVRGYRIETSTIETLLIEHPQIQVAAVVAIRGKGSQTDLIAFIVGEAGPSEIRAFLAAQLPAYHLPTRYEYRGELPLLATGKIDRVALERDATRTQRLLDPQLSSYQPPNTPVESLLAAIWGSMLGVSHIGRTDHFFQLGGHSLLAAKVLARIQHCFRVEVPLPRLFELPRLRDLAGHISMLRSKGHLRLPPIDIIQHNQPAPLSYQQRYLWRAYRHGLAFARYPLFAAVRLRGTLNQQALAQAVDDIWQRHHSLRIRVSEVGQDAYQTISEARSCHLELIDFSHHSVTLRGEATRAHFRNLFALPIDLEHDPLMRAGLIRLRTDDWVFYLSLHPLAGDRSSLELLFHETMQLYRCFDEELPAPLTPLTCQYTDFAYWQQTNKPKVRRAHQNLDPKPSASAAPACTHPRLPIDGSRPANPNYRGGRWRFHLDQETTSALLTLVANQKTDLYSVLFSGFATLLGRYSGQNEFQIAIPHENRDQATCEQTVGPFARYLWVTCDLTGDPSYVDLVQRLQESILQAYTHRDDPAALQNIEPQGATVVPRVTVQQIFTRELPNPVNRHLTQEWLDLIPERVCSEIGLEYELKEDHLVCDFIFARELFKETTLARMSRHWTTLLRAAARTPQRPISTLPLLGRREWADVLRQTRREQALEARNKAQTNQWMAEVHWVEHQTAMIRGTFNMSYRLFHRRADQLAQWLMRQGVKAGDWVGCFFEPSPEAVIAVTAILKMGAAVAPLDPKLPVKHLSRYMRAVRPKVLLTQASLAQAALPLASLALQSMAVELDTKWSQSEFSEDEWTVPDIDVDMPAYAVFNPGTPQMPGVTVISRRGLLNYLEWFQRFVPMDSTNISLWRSSLAHDSCFWEIFAPLNSGAILVIPEEPVAAQSKNLARTIHQHQVTHLHVYPSLLSHLLDEVQDARLDSLRFVMTSGQSLSLPLQDRFFHRFSSNKITLLNLYGPAECGVDTLAWTCRPRRVPLAGEPIDRMEAYILDAHFRPVPAGVPGELYLGGVGLALGYWGNPRRSAERFVPHPFSKQPGQRLFRTYERARFVPGPAGQSNVIALLGSYKRQIKVDNMRVDLGQIEAHLRYHQGIKDAAVLPQYDRHGGARLTAFIEPDRPAMEQEALTHWEAKSSDDGVNQTTLGSLREWSRYTGNGAITVSEWRESLEQVAHRIRALKPKRVLEMGCGMGSLMARVAPHCEVYHACEDSPDSIKQARAVQNAQPELAHVVLEERAVNHWEGLEDASYDAIIFPSQVHFYPSLEFLAGVIEQAGRVLRPGGFIFFDGIRDLRLMQAYHAMQQMRLADADTTVEVLRNRIKEQIQREENLLIHPFYFFSLQEQLDSLEHVQVLLKRGSMSNQINVFSYDVILHFGMRPESQENLHFEHLPPYSDTAMLTRALTMRQGDLVLIRGLRHAGIHHAKERLRQIEAARPYMTVEKLQRDLARSEVVGLDPEVVRQASNEHGAKLSIAESREAGMFSVLFRRAHAVARPIAWDHPRPGAVADVKQFSNDPLHNKYSRRLLPQVKAMLAAELPPFMVPLEYHLVPQFPREKNGAIDLERLTAMVHSE